MSKNYENLLTQLIDSYGNWFRDEELLNSGRMTKKLYPYTHIFSPIQINRITVKNRLVMGPMGNISMAEEMGRPSQKMVKYYAERARGGVGLITTGLVPISHYIDPSVTEPGDRSYFPRIDRSRTVFAGWRDITEAVHSYGSRIFIQLTPGLGRVGSPECLIKKFKLPISASWNPNFYIPQVPCRPLGFIGLKKIIKNTGQAAADARVLLFDGVYLHGHEGYFLEQMTNPAFNRRKFGRYADWQAFGLDLVKEIRDRVGPDFPIMYRIDLSLALNATYGKKMEETHPLKKFKNERTVAQTLDYMKNLVKAGVDIFDVDLGCYDNWWLPHPPISMPPGCYLAVARLVKEYFQENNIRANTGLEVPVVAVGKLGYPDLAEKALREGFCDMVMLARPLLADPDWPNKTYAGRVEEIIPCIGDQEGCINEFIEGGHPQCSVNPRTGNEDLLPPEPAPASHKKRIAVVGGGPAGVMCAVTAASRGHEVTLFEARDRLGGMLIPGGVPKIKYDLINYVDYLNRAAEKAAKNYDLKIKFNQTVSPEFLKNDNFDSLVVCVGGQPLKPVLPGIDLPHVVQAVDLLWNPGLADTKNRIVVVGGGAVGCEVAYFLAYELGKEVTVIEMLPYFMKGACTANRGHLIHYLERQGVKLLNCTKLKEIVPDGLVATQIQSRNIPDPYAVWRPVLPENIKNPFEKPIKGPVVELKIQADLVVLAMGLQPNVEFYYRCLEIQAAPEIYNIGDSFCPGRVYEAVKAGYNLGQSL
jgi:2-enoate reductase